MGQSSKTTPAPENTPSNKKREVQKIIFEEVPPKPVESEPKSGMARSLPRPERLQQPVLTSFPSTKPPILPMDLLPRLPGSSANPTGTAAASRICPGTAFCPSSY